jgi:hypothetical protein
MARRTQNKPSNLLNLKDETPAVAGRCSDMRELCVCLPVEGSTRCAVHDVAAAARASVNFTKTMGENVSPKSYREAIRRPVLKSNYREKFWPMPWARPKKPKRPQVTW